MQKHTCFINLNHISGTAEYRVPHHHWLRCQEFKLSAQIRFQKPLRLEDVKSWNLRVRHDEINELTAALFSGQERKGESIFYNHITLHCDPLHRHSQNLNLTFLCLFQTITKKPPMYVQIYTFRCRFFWEQKKLNFATPLRKYKDQESTDRQHLAFS